MVHDNPSQESVLVVLDPNLPAGSESPVACTRKPSPNAIALVMGLAALTAQASEQALVRDIQRYCTICWRNSTLDPRLWDDCTVSSRNARLDRRLRDHCTQDIKYCIKRELLESIHFEIRSLRSHLSSSTTSHCADCGSDSLTPPSSKHVVLRC